MSQTMNRIQLASKIRDYLSNSEVVRQIREELNHEISYCPILRNLEREINAGVTPGNQIKFSDLSSEDRNEVYVYLGRILESVLTCKLAKQFKVLKDRTSSGDVIIDGVVWEIKGTSGNNSWTGSTHASKKEDNLIDFIGIKYGMNEDVDVYSILDKTGDLIAEMFIGVFDNLKLHRRGSATKSNSRTSLLIPMEDYDKVKVQVAWGNFRIPQRHGKYLQFETA